MNNPNPKFCAPLGILANPNKKDVLTGMGKSVIPLMPGQLLTPHSHPNAIEIAYFISGTAEVGIVSPPSSAPNSEPTIDVFTVKKGDIVFFPRGFIHYVHNIGKDMVEFVLNFDNPDPGVLFVDGAFKLISPEIMGKAFAQPASLITDKLQNGGGIVPPLKMP